MKKQDSKAGHIDRSTYTQYEPGASQPDIKMLKKLCDVFDVDYNPLMDY